MVKNLSKKSNNQRSDVKNSNNDSFKAANDNRANQLNPNNPSYHASTKKKLTTTNIYLFFFF